MIKASELRTGNWFVIAREDNHFSKIAPSDFKLLEQNIYTATWQPILLTPSILKEIGFEILEGSADCYHYDLSNKGILFSFASSIRENTINLYFEKNWTGVSVTCLHQLQNLYFALTGEELEVNLSALAC